MADFAAWFNCVRDNELDTVLGYKFDIGSDDFMPEALFDANTNDDDLYNMDDNVHEEQSKPQELKIKGGMKLVKRTKPKIIRSVRFHIKAKILKIITESSLCLILLGIMRTQIC